MSAPKEDAKAETIARENQLTRKSNKALNGREQFTVEFSAKLSDQLLNAPHCHKSFTRKKAKLQEITT
jgi:hypothetical protein